jgi:deoxyribodipyrimidine photo-lyase
MPKRDNAIKEKLSKHGIEFKTFKDQVIFEKNEVLRMMANPIRFIHPISANGIAP